MMNMMYVPAMNIMLSEDVSAPDLRNPMNHLKGSGEVRIAHRTEKPGWIDAIQAVRSRG